MLVDKNISIYNIETLNVHLRRQLAFVAFYFRHQRGRCSSEVKLADTLQMI